MEKDPQIVARLAEHHREENWQFRTFLKRLPPKRLAEVDELAERLGREAEAEMDCRECGACCRACSTPIDEAETERLAGLLSLPVLEFRRQHMDLEDRAEPMLRAPCVFLKGNDCSIYEQRPDACRGYPYIGGEVAPRMIGMIERAGVCPIGFEMLEQLKQHMRFRRYR